MAAGGGGGFFLGDDIGGGGGFFLEGDDDGGGGGFFLGGDGGGFRTGAGDDVSPSSVARTAASHESSVLSNRVSFSLTRASL